jgi:hypothetical protein
MALVARSALKGKKRIEDEGPQLRRAYTKMPTIAKYALLPDETFEMWLNRLCECLPKLGPQPSYVPKISKQGTIYLHIPFQMYSRMVHILKGSNRITYQVMTPKKGSMMCSLQLHQP